LIFRPASTVRVPALIVLKVAVSPLFVVPSAPGAASSGDQVVSLQLPDPPFQVSLPAKADELADQEATVAIIRRRIGFFMVSGLLVDWIDGAD
jgi:hypothetical protein